jgi:hypothetical protein
MTSSATTSNNVTIKTEQKRKQRQQRQARIQSTKYNNNNNNNNNNNMTGTVIMDNSNNSSNGSNSSNSSSSNSNSNSGIILTPDTRKKVSFDTVQNNSFIEYETNNNNNSNNTNYDELWYTNRELREFRNDFIINIKSHHRYKKRQEMKNRVEIVWRRGRSSSPPRLFSSHQKQSKKKRSR